MQVFESLRSFQKYRSGLNGSVGFVPTMGNLHAGHQSLLERSVNENQTTILSIYVNPTQFNNPSDLASYPKTLKADLEMAEAVGVSAVMLPSKAEIYPDDYRYQVSEKGLSLKMEGEHRPGHFEGMLTIVLKLLMLAEANHAYFGEKDYQQLVLVKGMCEAFFVPTRIVGCPIIREKDGLAMSSRNCRLSDVERALAPQLYEVLTGDFGSNEKRITALDRAGFKVEYLLDEMGRRFVAAQLGDVRLIDNVSL